VCFAPSMINHYGISGKIVVVIDIFRASSAICTAISYGVKEIIPVKEIHEAKKFKEQGYITAAERDGAIVEGFDFGNSPHAFMDENLKGKTIVLTTSNCTRAIHDAKDAEQVLIGAFTNISAICDYLAQRTEDIILLCAGWKNKYNLEDSLFAGAVALRLLDQYELDCDSSIASMELYKLAKDNMLDFLKNSSHRQRLAHLGIEKDIDYCLQADSGNKIPIFNGYSISAMETTGDHSLTKKSVSAL